MKISLSKDTSTICFPDVLIYSGAQLQECLMNLLTYLLTYVLDSFRRDLKTCLFHSVCGHQNTD